MKKKINILHIIYSLHAGGAEEVVAAYAEFYNKTIFNLTVLVVTNGGPLVERIQKSGVKVYQLNKKKRLDFQIFRKIREIIHKENIEIIHAHNPGGNNWGVLPAKMSNVKCFLRTEHNVYYPGRVTRYYPIINYILNLFNNKIIACSEIVRRSQIKHYKIPERKIVTIRNGINYERFKGDAPKNYLNNIFNMPKNAFIIGTVGALIKQKGHETLIEAAKLVKKYDTSIYFLVVGDGKRKKELELLSKKEKVDDIIIFTGLRNDIPEIIKSIDIFALPSLWEGLPMVILEAMAANKAIIATDVGGNSEAIIDGQTGLLIDSGDSKALCDKILLLRRDNDLRENIASGAFKKFKNEFTAQTMVKTTEDLYLQLYYNK